MLQFLFAHYAQNRNEILSNPRILGMEFHNHGNHVLLDQEGIVKTCIVMEYP
jgi:hypothetical protein